MSVGHPRLHKLTASELDDLLDEALSNRKVKVLLARPFKTDIDHDVPLLGSSNVGWTTVYLDRHLPHSISPAGHRRLSVMPGLIRHERLEPILENVFGWKYPLAHAVATVYEHQEYRARGFDPAEIEKAYAPYIRADEREPLPHVPTDLDLRPMLGDAKLLERTRAAQDKEKKPQESVRYVDESQKRGRLSLKRLPDQSCGQCRMFVKGDYGGPACTLVKSPIKAAGWCVRFVRGKLEGGKE